MARVVGLLTQLEAIISKARSKESAAIITINRIAIITINIIAIITINRIAITTDIVYKQSP